MSLWRCWRMAQDSSPQHEWPQPAVPTQLEAAHHSSQSMWSFIRPILFFSCLPITWRILLTCLWESHCLPERSAWCILGWHQSRGGSGRCVSRRCLPHSWNSTLSPAHLVICSCREGRRYRPKYLSMHQHWLHLASPSALFHWKQLFLRDWQPWTWNVIFSSICGRPSVGWWGVWPHQQLLPAQHSSLVLHHTPTTHHGRHRAEDLQWWGPQYRRHASQLSGRLHHVMFDEYLP